MLKGICFFDHINELWRRKGAVNSRATVGDTSDRVFPGPKQVFAGTTDEILDILCETIKVIQV